MKVILVVIAIIIVLYYFRIQIYLCMIMWKNRPFFSVVDAMPLIPLSVDTAPLVLPFLMTLNIPNIQQLAHDPDKENKILDMFAFKYPHIHNLRSQLLPFDMLEFGGSYFPSAHTDIEWHKIRNSGFQVWSLVSNPAPHGNMFIFYIPYLTEKYKETPFYLRRKGNQIFVMKNCVLAEFGKWLNPSRILEILPVSTFQRMARRYYLDFQPGDTLMFPKNTLHMSDHRGDNRARRAFNFRVAVLDHGELIVDPSICGYVNQMPSGVPIRYSLSLE